MLSPIISLCGLDSDLEAMLRRSWLSGSERTYSSMRSGKKKLDIAARPRARFFSVDMLGCLAMDPVCRPCLVDDDDDIPATRLIPRSEKVDTVPLDTIYKIPLYSHEWIRQTKRQNELVRGMATVTVDSDPGVVSVRWPTAPVSCVRLRLSGGRVEVVSLE